MVGGRGPEEQRRMGRMDDADREGSGTAARTVIEVVGAWGVATGAKRREWARKAAAGWVAALWQSSGTECSGGGTCRCFRIERYSWGGESGYC